VNSARLIKNVVDEIINAEGIKSRKEKLGEFECFVRRGLPGLGLHKEVLDLVVLNIDVVVKDGFFFLCVLR